MKRKRPVYEDVSTTLVKHIFGWRFATAKLTRQSKIMNKIITKMLFEKDGTFFIPNDDSIANIIRKIEEAEEDVDATLTYEIINNKQKDEDSNLNNEDNANSNEDLTVTVNETIEVNEKFNTPQEIVFPSDIIKQLIRKANHIVIMNKCLCRSSADCKDYPQDLGCIFMGNATKKISRKYCREATVEEAIEHIDKCNKAGLVHIMGRNKIDEVWMHVSPGEELLTVCNCCPCCCLWRVYPNLSDSLQNNFYKLPGIEVYSNYEKCVGCGICVDICFTDAIEIVDKKAVIDTDKCKGCGQCSNKCPTDAMTIDYQNINVEDVFEKIDSLVNIEN